MYVRSAIPVYQLEGFLETFSSRGIEVVFIADACHSGNLAGGRDGKSGIASALRDNWKDAVKILSCQPGELSLEGEQWDGGRGLFSYTLTNGLAGLADNNNDDKISLGELNRYLINKVPDEAKPVSQFPEIKGDMNFIIANVTQSTLAIIKTDSGGSRAISMKGLEENLLKNVSDSVRKNYRLFKAYLDSGIVVDFKRSITIGDSRGEPYAWYYYKNIPDKKVNKQLIQFMHRNLAGKAIDQFNIRLNDLLDDKIDFYEIYEAVYLAKIIDDIYSNEKLKSIGFYPKKLLASCFYGFGYFSHNRKLNKAIAYEPNATYLYFIRGKLSSHRRKSDFKTCIEQRPQWRMPYTALAHTYLDKKMPDSAIAVGWQIHDLFGKDEEASVGYILGEAYMQKNETDSAIFYYTESIESTPPSDSQLVFGKNKYLNAANSLFQLKSYLPAKKGYLKVISLTDKRNLNSSYARKEIREFYYKVACCASMLNENEETLLNLETAFSFGYRYKSLELKKYFNNVRSTPAFIALLKKYFPEQYKEK